MREMLNPDPDTRLAATEVLELNWFATASEANPLLLPNGSRGRAGCLLASGGVGVGGPRTRASPPRMYF